MINEQIPKQQIVRVYFATLACKSIEFFANNTDPFSLPVSGRSGFYPQHSIVNNLLHRRFKVSPNTPYIYK